MDIKWNFDQNDIDNVKKFYKTYKNTSFSRKRKETNIERTEHDISREYFWEKMISCLLTTQQRSGPESSVTKFIDQKPFPLSYVLCKDSGNLPKTVEDTITAFGGIRRANRISDEVNSNFKWLETEGWQEIEKRAGNLDRSKDKSEERVFARYIALKLKGFGPKQARNLLQVLGLTKYEIPIDSRIVKWLEKTGFPVRLSAQALGDEGCYELILDGIQELCKACSIYPCELDAAIFSSYDTRKKGSGLEIRNKRNRHRDPSEQGGIEAHKKANGKKRRPGRKKF